MLIRFLRALCFTIVPRGFGSNARRSVPRLSNRFSARTILLAKIEEKVKGAEAAKAAAMAKTWRQKRKRSRRAKLSLLADKRHQAEKKSRRAAVREFDDQ